MNKMFFKSWMATTLFVACLGLTACDDDDNDSTPTYRDATEVIGSYSGTMQIVEAQPKDDDKAEAGTQLEATVTQTAVGFDNFPIRDLIKAVLGESGTDEVVDGIVEAVGPVGYSIPYTAAINEDQTMVIMALEPEVLNITMGNPEDGGLTIAVTISAGSDAVYNIETESLQFPLSVDKIQLGDGEPFSIPLHLTFDLIKI